MVARYFEGGGGEIYFPDGDDNDEDEDEGVLVFGGLVERSRPLALTERSSGASGSDGVGDEAGGAANIYDDAATAAAAAIYCWYAAGSDGGVGTLTLLGTRTGCTSGLLLNNFPGSFTKFDSLLIADSSVVADAAAARTLLVVWYTGGFPLVPLVNDASLSSMDASVAGGGG